MNRSRPVGSGRRIVPGPRAEDVRQFTPYSRPAGVHSDRLVRLRLPPEARGEAVKANRLHVSNRLFNDAVRADRLCRVR